MEFLGHFEPLSKLDTNEEYHSHSFVSSSQLAKILTSPLHFINARLGENRPTKSMSFGTLVHSVVLENKPFSSMPDFGDQRKKDNKEAKEKFLSEADQTSIMVTEDDANALKTILHNIDKNPFAKSLIEEAQKAQNIERSLYYKEPYVGCGFRSRPDGYFGPVLFDLKTTQNIEPGAFERDVRVMNYEKRLYFYAEGIAQFQPKPTEFFFIAIENKPPYDVVVYQMKQGSETYENAVNKYTIATGMLKNCLEAMEWRGVSNTPLPLK
jgi:PDDEXK-like domain of unknown function (DUF3799)